MVTRQDFVGGFRLDQNQLLAADQDRAISQELRDLIVNLFEDRSFIDKVLYGPLTDAPNKFLRSDRTGFFSFVIQFIYYRLRFRVNGVAPRVVNETFAHLFPYGQFSGKARTSIKELIPFSQYRWSVNLTNSSNTIPLPFPADFWPDLIWTGMLVYISPYTSNQIVNGVTNTSLELSTNLPAGQYEIFIRPLPLKQDVWRWETA